MLAGIQRYDELAHGASTVKEVAYLLNHPNHQEPVLMSVAWSSAGRGGSVVARHEWKGLSKMPGALEDFVEKNRLESQEQYSTGPRSTLAHLDSDDDEYMPESDEEED